MPTNPYNHIDMRVADLAAALPFYRAFLTALGFREPEEIVEPNGTRWQNFRFSHAGHPSQYFGLTEDPQHLANNNCVAFQADSRADVERMAEVIEKAGGQQIEGPCVCLEYSPHYYAVFCRDPSGNRLEVCHLERG